MRKITNFDSLSTVAVIAFYSLCICIGGDTPPGGTISPFRLISGEFLNLLLHGRRVAASTFTPLQCAVFLLWKHPENQHFYNGKSTKFSCFFY